MRQYPLTHVIVYPLFYEGHSCSCVLETRTCALETRKRKKKKRFFLLTQKRRDLHTVKKKRAHMVSGFPITSADEWATRVAVRGVHRVERVA